MWGDRVRVAYNGQYCGPEFKDMEGRIGTGPYCSDVAGPNEISVVFDNAAYRISAEWADAIITVCFLPEELGVV